MRCLCEGKAGITCNTTRCDLAGTSGQGVCRICWLRLGLHAKPTRRVITSGPCEYLGKPTGETRPCKSCNSTQDVPLISCTLHGVCTETKLLPQVECCKICPDKSVWPVNHDERSLWPGTPGKRFNPGLIEHEGGYLLAARNGWSGSEIYLGRLDREFRPIGPPWRLDLYHKTEANFGREDPRLFLYDGRVHIAYVGVVGGHSARHTNMLYTRLTLDLTVERVNTINLPDRQVWEKNWSFFSHDGQLYAVYSISPHKVIHVNDNRAEFISEEKWDHGWRGGEMRGGAPPVRIGNPSGGGDEYWHFFHDRVETLSGVGCGKSQYRTGLYAFEARPPFRPTRIIPTPIMEADPRDRQDDTHAAVVFTCGAVKVGSRWVLSSGIHDRSLRLDKFQHDSLSNRLVRHAPPTGWHWLGEPNEPSMWEWIHVKDEYRIRGLDLKGGTVLDIGAHVGTFTQLAVDLGAKLVHGYEPNPRAADLLVDNMKSVPEVRVYRAAVGGVGGYGRLDFPSEESTSVRVLPDIGGTVPVVTLDMVIQYAVSQSNDGRIRLLKIDCEGGELTAIPDCTLLHLVDIITGEWHGVNTPSILRVPLESSGFKVEFVPGGSGVAGMFFARRG